MAQLANVQQFCLYQGICPLYVGSSDETPKRNLIHFNWSLR